MQSDSLKAVAVWQRAQLECIRDAIRARVQMAEYKQSDADLLMPSIGLEALQRLNYSYFLADQRLMMKKLPISGLYLDFCNCREFLRNLTCTLKIQEHSMACSEASFSYSV